MKTSHAALSALFVAAAACGSSTGPTTSILKNDGYASGAPSFQNGFLTGDAAAVVLGPQSSGFTVKRVLFLFGGADTAETVTLTIYADAGTDNPGAVLSSHDYVVTPSNAALREIDVTAQNVVVDAGHSIRVALFFHHDALPCIAKDGDGITASRNYIYSAGWLKAESAGVTGDFVIRAEVVTN